MAKYQRHVFVCTNQREPGSARPSCNVDGKSQLQARFKQAVDAAGLKGSIRVNKASCLDQCEHGPTLVIYPEAAWYGHVTEGDVAEIVASHLVQGRPVKRLLLAEGCVNTGACDHRPPKT